MTYEDGNSEIPDRVSTGTRISLSGSVNSDLARRPRKKLRVPQQDNGDPDPYLFFKSRSETTVTSSKRFPGHGALGADPASLGNVAERRQEHRTAAIAERGKFGKLEC